MLCIIMQKNNDVQKSAAKADGNVFMSDSLINIIPVYNNPIRANIILEDYNELIDLPVLSLDKRKDYLKLVLLVNKENVSDNMLDIKGVNIYFNNNQVKSCSNIKRVKFIKENDSYIVKLSVK